jgi:Uma2 family endonuclease
MSTTHLRLGPADHGRALTIDEFREADEDPEYRIELARGLVEVTEVPNEPHEQIIYNLSALVFRYVDNHPGLIKWIGGASAFRLWIPEMVSGRNPDFGVVFHGGPKDYRGRNRPSLAAEVVSRRGEHRDYVAKREEYLVYGLDEYWIIDPFRLEVLVLSRRGEGDGASWDERRFRGSETIISPLLPGFVGRVDELWLDVEGESD